MKINRRSFILGSTTVLSTLYAPAVVAGGRDYNHYAVAQAKQGLSDTRIARSGDTWDSLFGDQAEVARFYNRQNLQLELGQLLLVPPTGVTDTMSASIVPFGSAGSDEWVFVLVSPLRYAWGLFRGRQLVRWGPAVCGADWCADIQRSCHSPTGMFPIIELSGTQLVTAGKDSPLAYFMRITDDGVGLHAMEMRGRHETCGSIGLFYDDARWLNQFARQGPGTLHVRVLDYSA